MSLLPYFTLCGAWDETDDAQALAEILKKYIDAELKGDFPAKGLDLERRQDAPGGWSLHNRPCL